jgi:hypothetical protein
VLPHSVRLVRHSVKRLSQRQNLNFAERRARRWPSWGEPHRERLEGQTKDYGSRRGTILMVRMNSSVALSS